MKFGVLGTGDVGRAIASRLIDLNHEVMMGSRTDVNEKSNSWANQTGSRAYTGTFAQAAAFGTINFNCTAGMASLQALEMAGTQNLNGKILVDVSNPLDFSKGMPPTLTITNDDSLGETIQRTFPDVKVVKTLNTLNYQLMVHPEHLHGDHNIFLSGNDAESKETVRSLLSTFGWKTDNIIDLGDITTARGTEEILPLWIRLMVALKTPMFNFNIVRG